MSVPTQTVVLGAGYLAHFLHEAMPRTAPVTWVRRTRPAAGARLDHVALDVTRAADVARLGSVIDGALARVTALDVVFMLPPSGLGSAVPAVALAPLLAMLRARPVRRAVVISSSGIYEEDDGACIDATTPVAPRSPRAQRLDAIEQAWRAALDEVSVLRFAGIYGPGRVIGRDAVLSGKPLPGAPEAWLNLIHAADGARAIVAALRLAHTLPLGLIADGNPVRRGDYYAALAALLGAAPAQFSGAAQARGRSKRLDPRASWNALGCAPQWPDYRLALATLVGADDAC
ncbi:MAG: NAD-dependent epimerase/dehydratase family protein [Gammaproteobacteria bacterium]